MSGKRTYRNVHYPPITQDVNEENLEMFFKFMYKRHNIWYRRFVKHLPKEKWTKDPILKVTKYTNVYRQLDRGSLWAIENILIPNWQNTKKTYEDFRNVLYRDIIYRLCVKIETFEKIGLPYYGNINPAVYLKRMYKYILSKKIPICTNAFLTLGGLTKSMRRGTGLVYAMCYLDINIDKLIEQLNKCKTGERWMEILKQVPGISNFMAYEVYCDLCYVNAIQFGINDTTNVGLGSLEGLRLIYPSTNLKKSAGYKKIYELFENQDDYFNKYDIKFKYMNWLEPIPNKLSLRTIEHSLCEFSKYWLQKHNLGKSRMIYSKQAFHPNCVVNPANGKSLVYNQEIYDKFHKLSNTPFKASDKYNKIKSKGWNKDVIIAYLMSLQNKFDKEFNIKKWNEK